MKRGLLIISVLVSSIVSAQYGVDRIRTFSMKHTDLENDHHSIQPTIRYANPSADTAKTSIFSSSDNKRSWLFTPVLDSYFQYDTSMHFRASGGVNFEKTWGKWYNRTQVVGGITSQEDFTQNHAAFRPLNNRPNNFFLDIRSRLAYTPNDQLHIAVGLDNQFFGEGYRSLIQGDQVAPAPFALIRANFWKLEYGLMYQFFHENNLTKRRLDWKYNTTHYLSWNATSNFNVTFFESVMFQGKDSTYKRGYEVEYLNPFVFFRPQEYSLGSTDNMMMALQTSYYFAQKKHAVYMQFSLDEFALKAIVKRTKWWANKYGFQLGMKGVFGRWNYRIEGNVVRPYTFSHISSNQNNGNLGLPLGHYLGSNFVELLTQFQVDLSPIKLSLFSSFVLKGYNDGTINYGGNIYQDYITHPKEYGNTIGQGLTQRMINLQVQAATLLQKVQMEFYIQLGGQYAWGEMGNKVTPSFLIGVRNNLFQERKIH